MLCAKFGWNWPSGSGEDDKNVKNLRRRQQRRQFWSGVLIRVCVKPYSECTFVQWRTQLRL